MALLGRVTDPTRPMRGARTVSPGGGEITRLILALLLGLIISIVVGITAVNGSPLYVIPIMLMIPAAVLLMRYPFASVILWMLVFPFVVRNSSGGLVPIYYAIHRAMIPGTLWLVLMQSWLKGRNRTAVRFGLAEYVMGLSLLWAFGSMLLLGRESLLVDLVYAYDRLFVPFCMYWLIRLIAPTAQDLKRFLPVAFTTLIIQATIGVMAWVAPSHVPKQWVGDAGQRVVGTFRNPAVFTTTVLFLSLLLFQYLINSKSAKLRTLGTLILGLGFTCVFISFSRGSWLGGSLVLVGLTLVYAKLMLRLEIVGLILAVVLGTTVFSGLIDFAIQRLNDQETVTSRFLTGAKSLGMIEQRPLTGWGFNNYDVYSDSFRVTTVNPASVKESDHTSHNTFLTVAAEQGIPALVLYLVPTLWWLLSTVAVWKRLPRDGFWSRTLVVVLWLVVLHNFTVSNFMDMIRFNIFGTTVYWMALALIAVIIAPYSQLGARPTTRARAAAGQALITQPVSLIHD